MNAYSVQFLNNFLGWRSPISVSVHPGGMPRSVVPLHAPVDG